ncbi:MAG: PrsW family glutamic-type intramembrane protease [Candidatus Gribaldobacteria bacterium]|nr:PrsW family glutamic-type intramembrane protease [Candidatus Gribaldobacteria bacterium]
MSYLFYLLGLAPSLIWLLFYLKKDKHPESNWMVLTTFLLGMAGALLILVLELAVQALLNYLGAGITVLAQNNSTYPQTAWLLANSHWLSLLISIFLAGAIIEEYIKYRTVRFWLKRNSEIDEPLDLMLYMIIGALGFAAMENILVLHNQNFTAVLTTQSAFLIIGWRFISATFLHALCSGIIGFFWALSICQTPNKKSYLGWGIVLAILLHGLYNWAIMEGETLVKIIGPLFLLLVMSVFVSFGFNKLKKMKGVCLIKE